MREKLLILITIVLLLGASLAAQQGPDSAALKELESKAKSEPNNIALRQQLGQMQFVAGRGRDLALLDAAQASFEHILAVKADEPRAQVWLGLTLASKAGQLFQAGQLAEAQPLITRGFAAMDRGIQASPKDPELRRLRGEVNLAVPEFMGRTDSGVADLEIVLGDPSFEKMGSNDQAKIYSLLGAGFSRQGKADRAQSMWQKAVEAAPGSTVAKEAEKHLNRTVAQPASQPDARAHRLADIPDNVSPIMAVASIRLKPGLESTAGDNGFAELFEAMKRARGFMGARLLQSPEKAPMFVAISWWKNRQALVDWYYNPAHQKVVKAFHSGGAGYAQPVQDTITHIGLDFYAPLRSGLSLGEKFGPTQKAVE